MAESSTLTDGGKGQADVVLEDFATRMVEVLNSCQKSTPSMDSSSAQIGIKLDDTNYALWSQIVEMYISGKDKLGYINGELPQPSPTDPAYRRWRTEDSIVKGWLINNMAPSLIGTFVRFPTAKAVWDAIATTYFDGTDTSQLYDLRRKVTRLRQAGGLIEKYYNDLQGLWREIDFRRPNPMECAADISRYNSLIQEERVYTFLDGLDDRLDQIRSDVLRMKPFPTVEEAYAYVRREDSRQSVMMTGGDHSIGSVMASKGRKNEPILVPRAEMPTEEVNCAHCNKKGHTQDTCFKLHGYPTWWKERKGRNWQADRLNVAGQNGKVAVAVADINIAQVHSTSSTNQHQGMNSSHRRDSNWIVDSGATDHMTYDPTDFSSVTQPRRSKISNANGVQYPVTGAGTVTLSPSLSLPNTLLIPSLSNKLLSVSQITTDLNCMVLMYPTFCLLQEILTKEIIGRGTRRGDLYYIDDFSIGRAN